MRKKVIEQSFMRKEINEVPDALRLTLESFNGDTEQQQRLKELFKSCTKLVFIGCGTAYHACLLGKHIFRGLLKFPVEAEFSSELACSGCPIDVKTLVVAVSQSGETADTLAAVKAAKEKRAKVLVVCNVEDSSLTKEADEIIYTRAGKEVAIAATKSYAAQILVFYSLALLLCTECKKTSSLQAELGGIPALIGEALKCERQIKSIAKKHKGKQSVLFAGKGLDFVTAKEASLKLKETSYTFSDGLAAGELRHGTMSLIDKDILVTAIASQKADLAKTVKLLSEVREKGGQTLLLTQLKQEAFAGCDSLIKLPVASDLFMPLISIVPLQLLALWTAAYKGLHPDRPRYLTKSVTTTE